MFTFLIVPFRITSLPTQWTFASLGYLCQTLRGFEFAAVLRYKSSYNCSLHVMLLIFLLYTYRSTGAYVQILSRILIRDMIPFGAIFGLFLFTFTGAFYFALRGEEIRTQVNTSDCSSERENVENATTVESSSLNLYPHLTK